MPSYLLLIVAFVTLVASAGSYFLAKRRLLTLFLILFYTESTFLSASLFSHQPFFLCTIIIVLVALPITCLILFALDTYYGLFCTDTSFVFVLVWLLIPALFFINFIKYLFKVLYA